MAKAKSYEEQMKAYEKQMEQLKARKQSVMAKHSKAVKKSEQAATFEVGRITLACFERGWESVDYGHLADVMRRNADVIGNCVVRDEAEVDPDRAAARLKEYQKAARTKPSATAEDEAGDYDDEG